MNKYNGFFKINDRSIKQGLEALASDISVPDPSDAYNTYREKYQLHYTKRLAASTFIVLLILAMTTIEPAAAIRNQIRQTITEMISRTNKLFQRIGGNDEPVLDKKKPFNGEVTQLSKYTALEELQKEKPADIFIPAGLQSNQFVSAEILHKSDMVLKASIFIDYDGTLLLLKYEPAKSYLSSGRVIDIEDFQSNSFVIKGHEVACFFDDRSYTMLEWENENFLFMLDGNMSTADLLDAALSLRVFD